MEYTFSSTVLSVRMRRDKLIVSERNRIHVFTFPANPKKLITIETRDNPSGLCEVTPYASSERQLMVFPGHKIGSIQLVDLAALEPGMSASPVNITAHKTEIACVALNKQGTMIATASAKVRIILGI